MSRIAFVSTMCHEMPECFFRVDGSCPESRLYRGVEVEFPPAIEQSTERRKHSQKRRSLLSRNMQRPSLLEIHPPDPTLRRWSEAMEKPHGEWVCSVGEEAMTPSRQRPDPRVQTLTGVFAKHGRVNVFSKSTNRWALPNKWLTQLGRDSID